MENTKIKILDDGPLEVVGDVELVDGEGNKVVTRHKYYLCRCGRSLNKPYCDNSHKGVFQSTVRANQ